MRALQRVAGQGVPQRLFDARRGQVRLYVQTLERRRPRALISAPRGQGFIQLHALGDDLLEQRLRRHVVDAFGQDAERFRRRPVRIGHRGAGRLGARVGRQTRGLGFLQNAEAGGRARLDRELPHDALAEGVDGLDLQPARRF